MTGETAPTNRAFTKTIAKLLVAALLATAVLLQAGIDSERTAIGLGASNIQSTAMMSLKFLGGLRTAAAAYLWIKVDRLHDDYYREDLDREQELIPLYSIVTRLDPHIVDAYYVGSFLLFRYDRPAEGWKFAMEGLAQNPDSAKLELNVGNLALFNKNDCRLAIPHLERAVRLSGEKDENRLLSMQALIVAYRRANLPDKAAAVQEEILKLTGKTDSNRTPR